METGGSLDLTGQLSQFNWGTPDQWKTLPWGRQTGFPRVMHLGWPLNHLHTKCTHIYTHTYMHINIIYGNNFRKDNTLFLTEQHIKHPLWCLGETLHPSSSRDCLCFVVSAHLSSKTLVAPMGGTCPWLGNRGHDNTTVWTTPSLPELCSSAPVPKQLRFCNVSPTSLPPLSCVWSSLLQNTHGGSVLRNGIKSCMWGLSVQKMKQLIKPCNIWSVKEGKQ